MSNTGFRAIASRDPGTIASNGVCGIYDTGCVVSLNDAGTIDGQLAVNAIAADNVQFIVVTQFGTSRRVAMMVAAGADITNASVGTFLANSTSPTSHVIGHSGKYAEFLSARASAINTPLATGSGVSIGRAMAGPIQHHLGHFIVDVANPTNTFAYGSTASVIGRMNAGTVDRRYPFSAFTGTGFTLGGGSTTGSQNFCALVVDGTFGVTLGSGTSDTTLDVDIGTDLAFAALWSHMLAESTVGTMQDGAGGSMGFATDQGAKEICMAYTDLDNSGTATTTSTAVDYNSSYININPSTAAVQGEGGWGISGDPGPGHINFIMDDADPAASLLMYAIFTDSGVEPPSGSSSSGLTRSWLNRNLARGY